MPTTPCSCPKRAPPPPRPTTLPYPATAANRELLERHLLDLYSASAFNVCEHQPLPMMAGPPLSLSIDPTAVPKPCHTPISIPIHWQDEVKAGLDRDVRLGVLEKVPLGTPVPPHGDLHQWSAVLEGLFRWGVWAPASDP